MTQEVQQELAEVAQPEVPVTGATAENPEVAEQETAEATEKHEETLEEKVARLEKESHGKQRRIDKQAAKLQLERESARQYRDRLEQIHNAQNPNRQEATPENLERIVQDRTRAAEVETKAVVRIEGISERDPSFIENLKAISEEAGPLANDRGLPSPLLEEILGCEKPEKVAKYLKNHPEIAAELEGLSAPRLARKLAVLEEGLKVAPKVSNAPEPIKPIGQRGSGTVKTLDNTEDMGEYIAMRKKQGARWAK